MIETNKIIIGRYGAYWSYTAPKPSIATLQDLRLSLSKSFASHIRLAIQKYSDYPPVHIIPHPHVPVPTFDDCPR
jgi:hypothetical protein